MPPQTDKPVTISDETFNTFMGLDDDHKSRVLAGMSPETKAALTGRLKERAAGLQAGGKAAETKGDVIAPHTWRDTIKEASLQGAGWLPSITGAAGGAIGMATEGPPGALAGAGLGGAFGKAGQHLIEGLVYGDKAQQRTLPQEAAEMSDEELRQMTQEAAGQVTPAVMSKLAHSPGAERWAARPLNKMLRADTKSFEKGISPGVALARESDYPVLTGQYGMKNFITTRKANLESVRDATVGVLTKQGRTVDLEKPISSTLQDAAKSAGKLDNNEVVQALANTEHRYLTKEVPSKPVADLIKERSQLSSQLTGKGVMVDLQTPVQGTLQRLSNTPKDFEMKKIVKSLQDLENRTTSRALPKGSAIANPAGGPPLKRAPRGLQNMSLDNAMKYRDQLQEMIDFSFGPQKFALKRVYDEVNTAIRSAAPEIAELDKNVLTLQSGKQIDPTRVSRNLKSTPLDEALAYRKSLKNEIGDFNYDTANPKDRALLKTYTAVTNAIHDAAPEIAKADEQIHKLIYAEEGMNVRTTNLERGTVERAAGKAGTGQVVGQFLDRHLPTRTTPYYAGSAKARRALVMAGKSPAKRAAAAQVPRILSGRSEPPDDEE